MPSINDSVSNAGTPKRKHASSAAPNYAGSNKKPKAITVFAAATTIGNVHYTCTVD